ncbi:hypothetical protein [Bradyrhizobium sp. USDA 10063]
MINDALREGQGLGMDWARILAYVTGTVDQELLARNEYPAAENRIIKVQLKGRVKLSDAERGALGEIGHRLGRKVLTDVATVARPDTILGWYRQACCPQVRWLEGASRPGQTTKQARGLGADHSHGQREPGLGL